MTKKKDYFTAIITGSIWTLICLALSAVAWWIFKQASGYIVWPILFGIVVFGMGIYQGRDFFKVELRTVRKNDPITDWLGYLSDLQLICITVVAVNSWGSFTNGFSWMGVGSFICGWMFVLIITFIKNTRFGK